MKPTIYVLCGSAGCGKSTYANSIENAVVVSSDAIRERLFGDASIQSNPSLVFDTLHTEIDKAIENGTENIIYDATSLTKAIRSKIINRFDARFVAVWFDVSERECQERNANRFRRVPPQVISKMFRKFEIPTYSEGFDAIIKIST